jgi:hypothetical protein
VFGKSLAPRQQSPEVTVPPASVQASSSGFGVAVGVGSTVAVAVGSSVGVAVGVGSTVAVAVGASVGVASGGSVAVAVAGGTSVAVGGGICVTVADGAAVPVAVAAGGVSSSEPHAETRSRQPNAREGSRPIVLMERRIPRSREFERASR